MKKAKEKKAKVEKPTTTPFGEGEVVSVIPLKKGSDKVALAKRLEEKAKPAKKAKPSSSYTRFDSVADCVQRAKSVAELITLADAKYVSMGGTANARESRTVVNFSLRLLSHFPDIQIPKE